MRTLWLGFLLALAFTTPSLSQPTFNDVAFATVPTFTGSATLRLDIHAATSGSGPRPVLVWIHGAAGGTQIRTTSRVRRSPFDPAGSPSSAFTTASARRPCSLPRFTAARGDPLPARQRRDVQPRPEPIRCPGLFRRRSPRRAGLDIGQQAGTRRRHRGKSEPVQRGPRGCQLLRAHRHPEHAARLRRAGHRLLDQPRSVHER